MELPSAPFYLRRTDSTQKSTLFDPRRLAQASKCAFFAAPRGFNLPSAPFYLRRTDSTKKVHFLIRAGWRKPPSALFLLRRADSTFQVHLFACAERILRKKYAF